MSAAARRLLSLIVALAVTALALLTLGVHERERATERDTPRAQVTLSSSPIRGKLLRPEAPAWSSANPAPERRAVEPAAPVYVAATLREKAFGFVASPLTEGVRAPCIAWRRHIPRMDSGEPPDARPALS